MLMSYDQCIELYGTNYLLDRAVDEGRIFRLEKGVYSDQKYVPEKFILAMKYPKAIYTMDSAFYHYNLTDVIPEKCYLATDRNSAKIPDKRVVQVFEKREILLMGVDIVERDGYAIRIYNKERMLVELLRHKTKLPFDYYKEILLNYREIVYDLDMRKVEEYVDASPKSSKIRELLQLEVL